MILGIGIDIIEIDRIKQSIDQYGDRFLKKVFTQTEIDYSIKKKNKYQHFAARFAAKEAIYKALSSDTKKAYSWQDVEIFNEKNGLPRVKLFGSLKNYLGSKKGLKISMSHSDNYVTCVAILHGIDNNDKK